MLKLLTFCVLISTEFLRSTFSLLSAGWRFWVILINVYMIRRNIEFLVILEKQTEKPQKRKITGTNKRALNAKNKPT